MGTPLLHIRGLSVGFTGKSGGTLSILRSIGLALRAGESVGIVGESGSGKSTLALAAMGYLKHGLRVLGGKTHYSNRNLFDMPEADLQALRGRRIALIPQNSGQSLTPTMRIGAQLDEALSLHSPLPKNGRPARILELLAQVRLPEPRVIAARYPHELSGGQQQRVAIAMALAGKPDVLLLDEPTTGLDVTTQAHILELLRELVSTANTAMLYVSHDLGAIARVCTRVVVMYAGEIVLEGATRQVLRAPGHPYARALLASIPRLNSPRLPASLEGIPPLPSTRLRQCAFAPRCEIAAEICRAEHPKMTEVQTGGTTQHSLCHFAEKAVHVGDNVSEYEGHRERDANSSGEPALTLKQISISYTKASIAEQLLGRRARVQNLPPPTVDDISFDVAKGETLALVGESGSGKSTILKAIAGLLPARSGDLCIGGKTLAPEVEQRNREQLRRIQMVFQNPDESLNPRHSIAEIIAQPLTLYFSMRKTELQRRSCEILESVRLGAHYLGRLPGQLSGGEKQRVAIARAFAARPEIVLCDEVTSALDVSVQAAVLRLLDDLRRERGVAYIFVSHDLAVVRALADRVAVLYQGRLCEIGATAHVYAQPSHPYTKALLNAALEPDPDSTPKLSVHDIIESSPPASGCPFQRRCTRRIGNVCDRETPPWRNPHHTHAIRCHLTVEELCAENDTSPHAH